MHLAAYSIRFTACHEIKSPVVVGIDRHFNTQIFTAFEHALPLKLWQRLQWVTRIDIGHDYSMKGTNSHRFLD
jgi:hypothetical protein